LTGELDVYPYDYLVMAAGSQPTYYGIKGAEEYSYKLWSYNDAMRLKAHTTKVFEKAMNENDPVERQRLLTFYIAGAGFTGVEMAGELAEWCDSLAEEFEIERDEVRIIEVDMLDRVVPTLTPELSAKAQRRLEKMGVQVILKAGIQEIGNGYIIYKKMRRSSVMKLARSSGLLAPKVPRLTKTLPRSSKVAVAGLVADAYLRAENKKNVFIVGDSMFTSRKVPKPPYRKWLRIANIPLPKSPTIWQ